MRWNTVLWLELLNLEFLVSFQRWWGALLDYRCWEGNAGADALELQSLAWYLPVSKCCNPLNHENWTFAQKKDSKRHKLDGKNQEKDLGCSSAFHVNAYFGIVWTYLSREEKFLDLHLVGFFLHVVFFLLRIWVDTDSPVQINFSHPLGLTTPWLI